MDSSIENNAAIDSEGKVPKRRFINSSKPSSGQWLYDQVRQFGMVGDLKDWERQKIEAHLRCAPPYSSEDLTALGMESMPNYSRGDMSMRIADEERKWTDLVTSHNGVWECDNALIPAELAERFNSELADCLNTVWMEDPAHVFLGQLVFRQFACFGIGPVLWADPYDPSPVARVASDFKFPRGTRIDLSNFTECALDDKINAQELYRAVSSPLGEKSGWKKSDVMRVLKSNANEKCKGCFDSVEKLELDLRSGISPWENYARSEIPVMHVWVEEFEEDDKGNTISYYMIAQDAAEWVILCSKDRAFAHPSKFMLLATDRVGSDGRISGLRGTGMEIRQQCETNDILACAAANAAFQSSVPIYQSTNQAITDTSEQITLRANGAIIPMGLTQVEAKLNTDAALGFIANSNNHLDERQGRYGLNAPNKGGVQRTAEESRQDAAKEGEIRSSQVIPLTVTFFVPLGQNFFDRLMAFPRNKQTGKPLKYKGWKTATRFDALLARTGLMQLLGAVTAEPYEFLLRTKIAFNSANTPGGLDKKLLRAGEMMKWMNFMTSQAQRDAVVNSAMVALNGWRGAQPYLNKSEADLSGQPLDERVSMENAVMAAGQPIPAHEFQDHLRHLGPLNPKGTGHCGYLMQKIAEVQNNQGNLFETDPLDGLGEDINALLHLKEHIDMHLAFGSHNPALIESDQIQPYFNFVSEVEGVLMKMSAGFQKELEQRQTQGQPTDPKVASMMALTQAKIASMAATTKATLDNAALKHNVKLGQQHELAGVRSQLKTTQTLTDMAVGAEKGKAQAIEAQTRAIQTQAQVAVSLRAKAAADKAKAEAEAAKAQDDDVD